MTGGPSGEERRRPENAALRESMNQIEKADTWRTLQRTQDETRALGERIEALRRIERVVHGDTKDK